MIRKAKLGAAALVLGAAAFAMLAGAAPAGAGAPPHGTPVITAAHGRVAPPVLLTCLHQPQAAPRRYVLACGDGSDYLRHLNWTVWSTTALATGTEWINDCVPDCARGTFRHYQVLVTLWRVRPLTRALGHFTRLTTIYTHKRPMAGGEPIAFRTWHV